jgi:hypothetical protein
MMMEEASGSSFPTTAVLMCSFMPTTWELKNGTHWVRRALIKPKKSVVAGPYVGPGDIVGSWLGWVGLYAFSAADAATASPQIDLYDQAGNNPITIHVKTDGTLDLAAISTWVTAHSVTTILISKLYDKTGNGNHLTSPSSSQAPSLLTGGVTGLASNRPAISSAGSKAMQSANAGSTTNQPIILSATFIVPGAAEVGIHGFNSPSAELISNNAADTVNIFANGSGSVDKSATHNVWHSAQGILNGASSFVHVDGVCSTGNPGTVGWPSGQPWMILHGNFSDTFIGSATEFGIRTGTTSNATLCSTAKAWNGY